MSEESTTRVIAFKGKKETFSSWKLKFGARAKKKGWTEILKNTVTVPVAGSNEAKTEAGIKILEKNDNLFADLILSIDTETAAGREAFSIVKGTMCTEYPDGHAGRAMTALIEKQMNDVLSQLKQLSEQSPGYNILLSIKGISEKQAALFIAETRDLAGFKHYKQLEKFAGYNLRQSQSSDYVGPRHINHIGNRRLSCILYKMCEETIKYIPEVRVKFVKRQLAKRSYRKNVVACASNLLRLIISLVKEGRMYEARGNKSVERLYYLEKKYSILKNRDRIRFKKVI